MLKKRGNGKWEKGKGEMGEEAAYYSGVDSTAQYSTVQYSRCSVYLILNPSARHHHLHTHYIILYSIYIHHTYIHTYIHTCIHTYTQYSTQDRPPTYMVYGLWSAKYDMVYGIYGMYVCMYVCMYSTYLSMYALHGWPYICMYIVECFSAW